MTDSCEVAWAAGFFDGEGCTTFSDRYMYVQVKQVDEEGIRRFAEATLNWGGVRGPVESKVETRSPIYVWRAHGQRAVNVMTLLWPWLGTAKREQFLRCFERWDEVRRPSVYCRNGHLLGGYNVAFDKRTPDGRACRTCKNERERLRYHEKKSIAV